MDLWGRDKGFFVNVTPRADIVLGDGDVTRTILRAQQAVSRYACIEVSAAR